MILIRAGVMPHVGMSWEEEPSVNAPLDTPSWTRTVSEVGRFSDPALYGFRYTSSLRPSLQSVGHKNVKGFVTLDLL